MPDILIQKSDTILFADGVEIPAAFLVTAALTDFARAMIARSLIDGTSLQVKTFAVGSGGHDTTDFTSGLSIGTAVMESDLRILVFGPEPIDIIEDPNDTSKSFYLRVEGDEAIAALSEIGVYAEIQNSPFPAEDGTTFLFAIGHFAAQTHVPGMISVFRMIVNQ